MDAIAFDAAEAGALLGLTYQRARRMVQLHRAPEPIRAALGARRIDARAALELVRIHNRMTRGAARHDARAHQDLEMLVTLVAREHWSIRQLEEYARTLASRGRGDLARPTSSGFRLTRGRLVVNTARVARGELGPRDRALLTTILEDLLRALKAN
jgi:hypothetical protein